MDEEWIWLWFRSLRLNKDYCDYCDAQQAGDTDSIKKLQVQFPKIHDVFTDFGDIHAFNYRASNRKHWFAWLKGHRALFETTTKKRGRQTITIEPLYKLNFKQAAGELQLQTVRRCLAVWHRLNPIPGTSRPTVQQLTRLFAGHELGNPAVWDDWSTAKIDRRGVQEDYERQIKRYKQKGQKIIDRTIDGIFPAYK